MGKSEFRNFFNHGVTEVNTVKQSTTVTSVRSYGYKVLWENKRVDACGAEAARSSELALWSCLAGLTRSIQIEGMELHSL